MIWVKLEKMTKGTPRAHWFAYCWSCQRKDFRPGMFLCEQLYFNPFVHTEPICIDCAKRLDNNFGKGTKLEKLPNGTIKVLSRPKLDERECPHEKPKKFYPLDTGEIVFACSWVCANEMGKVSYDS